jgi:acetolactate decarboxylase
MNMKQGCSFAGALLSIVVHAMVPCVQCAEDDVLFQVSTIDALLQGVFDGFFTIEDLKKHGDFGIGTFDSLGGR